MDQVQKHLFVLILAGGGGTRLWPQSREDSPKQFAKLFGGKSLFEITLSRALEITPAKQIIVSTAAKYVPLVRKLARQLPAENIIGEPMRRDTALAMGVASTLAVTRDPKAVIVNMASDHLISPESVFVSQVKAAAKLALLENYMVTIGIKPTFPHTGLGHIKAKKPFNGYQGILQGEKFVEKPPLPLAKRYTASGDYYWNTNLFVFKAQLLLDLLEKHSPKVFALLPKLQSSWGTNEEKSVLQMVFQMTPAIAIDYAVAEKLKKFICIPAKFHWTDVGDWKEIYKNLPHDESGNVIEGPSGRGQYIGINSKNNLLFLDKKIIATVGLEDMLIVDTPDALLVCPKEYAQGVKQIVQALKEQKLDQYL
jgi:mannose-1-phosphate guanylyltransferase